MKIAATFLALVFLSSPAFPAESKCPAEGFEKNGLYYSASGEPRDAWKNGPIPARQLPNIAVEQSTALTATVPQPYSPGGRFFLQSGVNDQEYVLIPPGRGQEAVLVRRVTFIKSGNVAEYVSIGRADLKYPRCSDLLAQPGLSRDRNFITIGRYTLVHSNVGELRKQELINKKFHFEFTDANRGCRATSVVVDSQGRNRTQLAYVGRSDVSVTTRGEIAVEQGVSDVAGIFLPNPAYARRVGSNVDSEGIQLIKSSVEASLHDISGPNRVCIDFPAPVPTSKEARGWFFNGINSQENKSLRLAKSGKWITDTTEIHFQQIANAAQTAFIRVKWTNSK